MTTHTIVPALPKNITQEFGGTTGHRGTITRARAEELLHGKLLPGWRKDAVNVIETIQERASLMQDRVVKSAALDWALGPTPPNHKPGENAHPLVLNMGGTQLTVHKNALQQASGLADIPQAYVNTLAKEDPGLLVENLNKRFDRRESRQLVRSVSGQALAVLSDKYRRLDSRPIIENIAINARELGLVPMGGAATDLQFRLRMCLPEIFEIFEGEFVMVGFNWSNSDVGRGAHDISTFILRPICNNGAVTESNLRQIHLGKRMTEDGILSDRTLQLDTEAAASAVGDILRAYLDPAKVEEKLAAVRLAAAKDITPQRVDEFFKKHLSKEAVAHAKEIYNTADVEMLPPGNTVWRMSNVLSWMANEAGTDKDVALDYQELAGKALALVKPGKMEEAAAV